MGSCPVFWGLDMRLWVLLENNSGISFFHIRRIFFINIERGNTFMKNRISRFKNFAVNIYQYDFGIGLIDGTKLLIIRIPFVFSLEYLQPYDLVPRKTESDVQDFISSLYRKYWI